jgi:hypothetical protein
LPLRVTSKVVKPLELQPLSTICGDAPLHCPTAESVKGVGPLPPHELGAVAETVPDVVLPEEFLAVTE